MAEYLEKLSRSRATLLLSAENTNMFEEKGKTDTFSENVKDDWRAQVFI